MNDNSSDLLPRRDKQSKLERESIEKLPRIFPAQSFVIREESMVDVGIDLTIELAEDVYTNNRVNVQVKSVDTGAPNLDGSISKSLESQNLKYLLSSPLLALYIFYVKQTDTYYFEWADEFEKHLQLTVGNWSAQETNTLRFKKVLDDAAVSEISRRIRLHARYYQNIREGIKVEEIIGSFHEPYDARNYQDIEWSLTNLIDTFDGLAVLPKHILTKFPPFSLRKDSRSFFTDFNYTLYTDNQALVNFFRNLSVAGNTIQRQNSDESINQKVITQILNFFEYNSINHVAMVDEHLRGERVCIHNLYFHAGCDCEKCSYAKLHWGTLIKKLEMDFDKEETYMWLRRGYMLLELGKISEAFELYKSMAKYTLEKEKYVSYIIARYNLVSMLFLVRSNYFANDTVEMESEIRSIDLRLEISNLATRTETRHEVFQILLWLIDNDYIHQMYVEIDIRFEEVLTARHLDQRGGVVSEYHYNKMIGLVSEMTVYAEGNAFHPSAFNGFKRMVQKGIESALILATLKNPLARKLESFNDYLTRICLLYGEPSELNKLFNRYKAYPITFKNHDESHGSSLSDYLDNGLTSFKNAESFCALELSRDNRVPLDRWNNQLYMVASLASIMEATDEEVNRITLDFVRTFSSATKAQPGVLNGLHEIFNRKRRQIVPETYIECYKWLIISNTHDFHLLTIDLPYYLVDAHPEFVDQDITIQNSILTRLKNVASAVQSNSHVIISYWKIAAPTVREKISESVNLSLIASFDATLYFNAAYNSIIDLQPQLDMFIQRIPMTKQAKEIKQTLRRYDDFRNDHLNEFIALAFKFDLRLESESIQALHENIPYYEWLMNLQTFDYSRFDPYWILYQPSEVFFNEFKKHPQIKQAIKKYLKQSNVARLSEVYVQYLT